MEVLGEINSFCRFCLSQDCELLMPLSSAIEDLSFSIQDIQQTTGVLILESEVDCLTACRKCINRIELAVDFRRSCINGNILFMQLFGHIINKHRSSNIAEEKEDATYGKNDPLKIEILLQTEAKNENTLEGEEELVWSLEELQEICNERTFNGLVDCADGHSRAEDLLPVPRKSKITNKRAASNASNPKKTLSMKKIGEYEEDKISKPLKRKTSGKARKRLCGICGALVFNMVDHIRSHTKENLLKCPHCPVQMANGANLLRHVRAVHEKVIVKSCETCDKGFTTNNAFKSHMVHEMIQKHHKTTFITIYYYTISLQRTHHNIGEQYQCEICLKTFNHASNRRDHMKRIHTSELKYECQICQKKFKHTNSLKRHGRVHSTNALFACSYCPKRFKSSCTKRKHEITHSGIQFACTLCTKVYRYKTLLNMHYRKCHPAAWSDESVELAKDLKC
ncbi:zinc finger protein 658B-like isoform X2 [Anopheles darlingi]|uniref:zinc finger protein 658B-like isoform X2 n=1 Tax=Anopheles darlingi TaxID=43151 RepID=UPI0021001382|nr:zinc finger protein 658B-like isoform X2 [Anopheles darlingi]